MTDSIGNLPHLEEETNVGSVNGMDIDDHELDHVNVGAGCDVDALFSPSQGQGEDNTPMTLRCHFLMNLQYQYQFVLLEVL